MCDVSEGLTVILTTIWWLQNLGTGNRYANELQTLDMQRFDLKKLSDADVKEHYQVKISNRFAAL
jgi:hypothetical protein